MDLPPLESFDEAQPEAYYLGSDKQFAALADAAFLVEWQAAARAQPGAGNAQ
jgi:hypothetical protein